MAAGALDRWDRSRRLEWFDLARVRAGRVLVAGAGALGNEVVKNLTLSGVGHLVLVDPDHVEASNLNRCVLFTDADATARRPKAVAVADAAERLVPDVDVRAISTRVEDLDGNAFTEVDAVVACVDNVAARLHLNAHARHAGRVLVDGATDGLLGKVQVVWDPDDACVECGTNATHRRNLDTRFSCTGRDVTVFDPVRAAEITTTSVIAAVQAREVVKALHGLKDARQRGVLRYDGFNSRWDVLETRRRARCPHHGGE